VLAAVDADCAPVEIRLKPRGAAFQADDMLWALRNVRAGRGHPLFAQHQEAVLLPKHLAVVSELGQESLASWLSGHRATGTRPHLSAARQLFQQLLTALEFCSAHHMGFVDLRPQSIMLHLSTFEGCEGDADALTLKLAGFVSLLSGHGRYGDISAAGFIAPEVNSNWVNGRTGQAAWVRASVWAAGAVLHALLTGHPPGPPKLTSSKPQVLQDILEESKAALGLKRYRAPARTSPSDFQSSILPEVPSECRELLKSMLQCEPKKRPTLAAVKAHPWVACDMPPDLRTLNSRVLALGAHPGAFPTGADSPRSTLDPTPTGNIHRGDRNQSSSDSSYGSTDASAASSVIDGDAGAPKAGGAPNSAPPAVWRSSQLFGPAPLSLRERFTAVAEPLTNTITSPLDAVVVPSAGEEALPSPPAESPLAWQSLRSRFSAKPQDPQSVRASSTGGLEAAMAMLNGTSCGPGTVSDRAHSCTGPTAQPLQRKEPLRRFPVHPPSPSSPSKQSTTQLVEMLAECAVVKVESCTRLRSRAGAPFHRWPQNQPNSPSSFERHQRAIAHLLRLHSAALQLQPDSPQAAAR